MCGIFGYFLYSESAYNPQMLRSMGDAIQYRGPDGEGFFEDREHGVGIGNKRLSIIDIKDGAQPFISDDGAVAVVQNGEIFNFIELAQELKQSGVRLKTHSDTEILLRLYEREGIRFIHRLNGMFAIAIYDKRLEKLFLVRDRVGVKPLYFHKSESALFFSSEIKSILSVGVSPKIDIESLQKFFTFNYVPSPFTIFQGIYHVEPGCYLEISKKSFEKHRWWSLENKPSTTVNDSDVIAQFHEILSDAVKIRMRSDVPFGAFLSGGVDSSTIVGLMSRISKDPIRTYSIGFHDERFDETPYAEEAARRFNTIHKGKRVGPEIITLWNKLIFHCDQPHGDTSFIPTYIVSDLASRDVKVVLTGDGGDELWGGYEKFPQYLNQHSENNFTTESYGRFISVIQQDEVIKLFKPIYRNDVKKNNPYNILKHHLEDVSEYDTINKMLYLDFSMLLPGNNLVKPDRMGMAVSIEARTPFLDYRMVEFAFSLPGSLKVREGQTKYIYKKAVENLIGSNLTYRKKQMFTVPMGEWIKDSLRDTVRNILIGDSYLQNYLDMDYVKTIVEEHLAGVDRTRAVRQLLAFEFWCREFMERENTLRKCV